MADDVVYLGHDNTIRLMFTENGEAVDLNSVTKMSLTLGGVTIESENEDSDPIVWNKEGMETGEVVLSLGSQTRLKPRVNSYDAVLVIYDPSNPQGFVWGSTKIFVKGEVEVKTSPLREVANGF